MNINKYPDGSSYVSNAGLGLHNSIFRVNNYQDLWHLHQSVDAYYNLMGSKPTITIPCLIDAQADRRFNSGESSGLKLVCKFLNKMNANFKIFHPHNPEVVEALMDNVEIIDNSYFINSVIDNLGWKNEVVIKDNPKENIRKDLYSILMSSDSGGFKPLIKLCDKIEWKGETFSASK